jgi:cruciform cutting endonuclease 1
MSVARCVRGFTTKTRFAVTYRICPDTQTRSLEEHLAQLKALKSDQLAQLAISCGTPCSGTKDVLSKGLLQGLAGLEGRQDASGSGQGLSLVSIDMGIRNLAYCHIKTSTGSGRSGLRDVELTTWRRVDVSSGAVHVVESVDRSPVGQQIVQKEQDMPIKESFEPGIYAERAYNLISRVLDEHKPTHVLLERQRFRSGGGPAVQEWTLRVGMFEFMLYATLHTLKTKGFHDSVVVPVLPPMVNRFWLAESAKQGIELESKPTSAAMKKFKIDHVSSVIEVRESIGRRIKFSRQADELGTEFLARLTGVSKKRASSITKLDDLSDCLLQGLAWVAWQEHRQDLQSALRDGSLESLL